MMGDEGKRGLYSESGGNFPNESAGMVSADFISYRHSIDISLSGCNKVLHFNYPDICVTGPFLT